MKGRGLFIGIEIGLLIVALLLLAGQLSGVSDWLFWAFDVRNWSYPSIIANFIVIIVLIVVRAFYPSRQQRAERENGKQDIRPTAEIVSTTTIPEES